MAPIPLPLDVRFWSKVDKTSTPNGCWLWTAFVNPDGYGQFWLDDTCQRAHRLAYALTVGSIPEGLTVDHRCRVRHCVNPSHLRVCTIGENVLEGVTTTAALNVAKTACPHGHLYDEANTYTKPDGARARRECRRQYDQRAHDRRMETQRQRRARRKAAAS